MITFNNHNGKKIDLFPLCDGKMKYKRMINKSGGITNV